MPFLFFFSFFFVLFSISAFYEHVQDVVLIFVVKWQQDHSVLSNVTKKERFYCIMTAVISMWIFIGLAKKDFSLCL